MQDPNTHYIGGTLNQTPIEVVDLETFLSEEGLPIATIEWERGWEHVLRMAIDTARADAVEEATPIAMRRKVHPTTTHRHSTRLLLIVPNRQIRTMERPRRPNNPLEAST